MEYGSIEREIHVEASPEVVFEVISSPEHLSEWWPDEAHLEPRPGAVGELVFGSRRRRARRSCRSPCSRSSHHDGSPSAGSTAPTRPAAPGNSLLVTFDLVPSGAGTTVRMRETGFRELGWEAAVLEEQYREHVVGWDHFLPLLERYVARLVASR